MYITKLILQNFRNIGYGKLDFAGPNGGITALVGPNCIGKTNTIKVLEILKYVLERDFKNLNTTNIIKVGANTATITAWFKQADFETCYSFEISQNSYGCNEIINEYFCFRNKEYRLKRYYLQDKPIPKPIGLKLFNMLQEWAQYIYVYHKPLTPIFKDSRLLRDIFPDILVFRRDNKYFIQRGETLTPIEYESNNFLQVSDLSYFICNEVKSTEGIIAIDDIDMELYGISSKKLIEALGNIECRPQVLLTSHQLGIIDTWGACPIYMTTNSENKFVHICPRGNSTNMTTYYRAAILGGAKEELYKDVDSTNLKVEMSRHWGYHKDDYESLYGIPEWQYNKNKELG